jgi:putative membrane protein
MSNPWFWAKMASFLCVGLLSIPPTLALLKWRKARSRDQTFLPADGEIARLRGFVHAEVGLLALVVGFAAAMARYGAF